MAFQEGWTPVGTAPVATVDPGIRGALIQNIGQTYLTIGGPNVVFGHGPILPPGTAVNGAGLWVYGAPVIGELQTDFLHAVGSTAAGSIAWVAPI